MALPPGRRRDSLYVVRSGRLEVVIEQPSTVVVRVLTRGAVVGELALLTRERRSASVRARRDCELLRVSSTDFAELLSHEPRFSLALMRELGRQLRVSRALEPPEDPLPATIAIVADGAADARQLAETLQAALAELGTVTLLDELQADGRRARPRGARARPRAAARRGSRRRRSVERLRAAPGRPRAAGRERAASARATPGRRDATCSWTARCARRSPLSGPAPRRRARCTGSRMTTARGGLRGGLRAGPSESCCPAAARAASRTSACSRSCWPRIS